MYICACFIGGRCQACAADLSSGTKSLTCSPGCTAGLVPRDVVAIESPSCAEVEVVLSVSTGTSAAAAAAAAAAAVAPRQIGRRTRSSTS